MIPDRQWRRAAALEAAAALPWPQTSSRQLANHVLAVAEIFDEWLAVPAPDVASFTFTWTVDTPSVLTLTPSADTLSCLAVPNTASGAVTVTATASDGVARTFAIDVTTGPTAGFQITADAPVDRPAPAAPTAGA